MRKKKIIIITEVQAKKLINQIINESKMNVKKTSKDQVKLFEIKGAYINEKIFIEINKAKYLTLSILNTIPLSSSFKFPLNQRQPVSVIR